MYWVGGRDSEADGLVNWGQTMRNIPNPLSANPQTSHCPQQIDLSILHFPYLSIFLASTRSHPAPS